MAKTELDLVISTSWTDLAASYTELANASALVQCKGGSPIFVVFSASGTAPAAGNGQLLLPLRSVTGTAAHIWVMASSGTATISCGLNDTSSGNLAQETGGNLATIATAQGTPVTGFSLVSGSGILGWLSAILQRLTNGIGVTGTFWQTTQPVSLPQVVPIIGQQATTTSAAALPTATSPNGVVIRSLPTNLLPVWVGPTGLTAANGWLLMPGESKPFNPSNLNLLSILGGNTVDRVCYSVE